MRAYAMRGSQRRMYRQIRRDVRDEFHTIIIIIIMILLTIFVLIQVYDYFIGIDESKPVAARKNTITPYSISQMVHLDLKGAPPKMSYLKSLVSRLAELGVDGILIEYEDMFPYEGSLRNISSPWPYSKSEILEFLSICASFKIDVIPMIQTLAHMEYILKMKEFRYLREDLRSPSTICPSNTQSLVLIKEMLRQVLALHPNSTKIHIGCDGISTLNMCPRCLMKRKSKMDLSFDYVENIASFIQDHYGNEIRTLIWDDLVRWKPIDRVKASNLPDLVEIVIWDFTPFMEGSVYTSLWDVYKDVFKRVWLSGAFRGADDSNALVPTMMNRHENHKVWMWFIENTFNKSKATVEGFISAGWSRYHQFETLYELLPASIPSLVLNSIHVAGILKSPRYLTKEYTEKLRCDPDKQGVAEFNIEHIYNLSHVHHCSFAESQLVYKAWQMQQLQRKIQKFYDELRKRTGLKYNLFSSLKINKELNAESFNSTYYRFFELYSELGDDLKEYYRDSTIREWLETHVEPYSKMLLHLKSVQKKAVRTILPSGDL